MSKKMPEPDALRFAAERLRQYDDSHDGGGNTGRATAVADWLDEQASAAANRSASRASRMLWRLSEPS